MSNKRAETPTPDARKKLKKKKGGEEGGKEDRQHDSKYPAEYFPRLLDAIKKYADESELPCLDLRNLIFEAEQLKDIFNILSATQVIELNLENNDLRSVMSEFGLQLANSNVKKLSLQRCKLQLGCVLTLLEVLKKTQVTDLDLSCLPSPALHNQKSAKKFIALLKKLPLTHLRLSDSALLGPVSGKYLATSLPQSTITHLGLEHSSICHSKEALQILFKNLPESCVTELYLGRNELNDEQLKPLFDNLKQSKLEKLSLVCNKITDIGMNKLSAALAGSNVRELIMAMNKVSGANDFGKYLKDTNITVLDLSRNKIKVEKMLFFPDHPKLGSVTELDMGHCSLGDKVAQNLVRCLKYSKVSKINLSGNDLGLLTVAEFANILEDSEITDVDFSENNFSSEALQVLGKGIKDSKLNHLKLSGNLNHLQEGSSVAEFVDKTKATAIKSLDISCTNFANKTAILATSLKNVKLTHLNLSSCRIGTGVADLAQLLKHTVITYLNLSNNEIDDVAATNLAKSINDSKISHLEMKDNLISDTGAEALVLCLKTGPLYQLNLEANNITNDGMRKIARMIDGTSITNLEVSNNPGHETLPIVTAIWKNRLSVHKMVKFFQEFAPTALNGGEYCFNSDFNDADFNAFVETCLLSYKAAVKDSSAINALANVKGIPFSREQVSELVAGFPRLFTSFMLSQTNLKVSQLVSFLERAKLLELNKVAEVLLGNLAAMIIKNKQGIFIPSAYKSIKKFKAAILKLELNPEEKKKVVQYFTARPNCCGLCGKTSNLTKTQCCKNWVCDEEEDEGYSMSYFDSDTDSCVSNHQSFTLCGIHYKGRHKGKWQDCKKCRRELTFKHYVDYGTNDFNFEKLENAPKINVTCEGCGIKSDSLRDFDSEDGSRFYCQKNECQRLLLEKPARLLFNLLGGHLFDDLYF